MTEYRHPDDDWRMIQPGDYVAYWRARREQERSARLARKARRQRLIGVTLVITLTAITVGYLGYHLVLFWLGGG